VKTVSALEMRKNFGQLLDEAAAGERIIIERAGQPRAILVPMDDLDRIDPDVRLAQRREALDELIRMAKRRPFPPGIDGATAIRRSRDEREAHIAAVIAENRRRRP
jgi:prevent-host-death family protein